MRMRKKKWADPYIAEHKERIYLNPTEYKGKWHALLNCFVLHIEIGMGKGDYLNAMATMFPKEGWVGIERDHSAAAVAVRKAVEAERPDFHNKRMICGDAEHLAEWFAEGEVQVIHLNFSDPWPKTYTHKRRLSSKHFLEIYRTLLDETGTIRMKTDNRDLFSDSVLYFQQNGFLLTEFSLDYRKKPHEEDAVTEYERRFMDLGQPIYQLCALKQKTDMVQ